MYSDNNFFSGVVEKCSTPSRCSARPRYIYLPEEKVPSQKELDFCAWRWPLLDAKDKKVERNIWLTFIHYPSDIKTVKGILHQKISYGLNLIFWIVMGCGIARFGGRGLKTTKT